MVPKTDVIKGQWSLMSLRFKRIMVPNTEVSLAEDQNERSIQDTKENEANIYEVEIKDSIQDEMLMSISTCALPMGTLDGRF